MAQYSIVGGKEKGLLKLKQHEDLGYRVPNYAVIPIDAYSTLLFKVGLDQEEDVGIELSDEIRNMVQFYAKKLWGRSVMVRSNSKYQDYTHGFAGVYYSEYIESVSFQKLAQAVIKVYHSMFSTKAMAYRQKHHLKDDEMGVLIHPYIEGEIHGTLFTSNPNSPDRLTIEYQIVAGKDAASNELNHYVIEYEKTVDSFVSELNVLLDDFMEANDGDEEELIIKEVFRSQNLRDQEEPSWVSKLGNIGLNLEKIFNASEIEFIIKDKQIYFVQCRKVFHIFELEKPFTIPDYPQELFLESLELVYGQGELSGPVIKVHDPYTQSDFATIPEKTRLILVENWAQTLKTYDQRYQEGYILVINQFAEKILRETTLGPSHIIGPEQTLNEITPHKKAIISAKRAGLLSHVANIAREETIFYAEFAKESRFMSKVETGDVISMYCIDRKALVYKTGNESYFEEEENFWSLVPKEMLEVGYDFGKELTLTIQKKLKTTDYELVYHEIIKGLNESTSETWEISHVKMLGMETFTNKSGDFLEINNFTTLVSTTFIFKSDDQTQLEAEKFNRFITPLYHYFANLSGKEVSIFNIEELVDDPFDDPVDDAPENQGTETPEGKAYATEMAADPISPAKSSMWRRITRLYKGK